MEWKARGKKPIAYSRRKSKRALCISSTRLISRSIESQSTWNCYLLVKHALSYAHCSPHKSCILLHFRMNKFRRHIAQAGASQGRRTRYIRGEDRRIANTQTIDATDFQPAIDNRCTGLFPHGARTIPVKIRTRKVRSKPKDPILSFGPEVEEI